MNLNIWNWGWGPISRPLENVKNFFRCIRDSHQRITRGFCFSDIWNMNEHCTQLLADMLNAFADNTVTIPKYADSLEEWQDEIRCAANLLHTSIEENRRGRNPYEDWHERKLKTDYRSEEDNKRLKKWLEWENRDYQKRMNQRKTALNWFITHMEELDW